MQFTKFDGPKAKPQQSLELDRYFQFVQAVAEVINKAKEIPSGHLYAMLMGYMSLQEYNNVINLLKRTKLIREQSYLLTWTGPEI